MTLDPFAGVLIGLAAWVTVGLFGAWFAGLFDAPPAREQHDIAAE
jgi:hypothetical protein